MASSRVLLTGGGGFIGSWIMKALLRRGVGAVGSLDVDVCPFHALYTIPRMCLLLIAQPAVAERSNLDSSPDKRRGKPPAAIHW
jgi:nucleoside-diphosphate-sugar epimerase